MTTKIKAWQIIGGKLHSVNTSMSAEGRTEKNDLEQWIKNYPELLGEDIALIAEQPMLPSGSKPDFLGIDEEGNLVIIELKKENPREALTQAIDYASEVASSFVGADEFLKNYDDKCSSLNKGKKIKEILGDKFGPDFEFDISSQKIILIGTEGDSKLERMVEWLSENYGLDIRMLILTYTKTKEQSEILIKTSVFSDDNSTIGVRRKKRTPNLSVRIKQAVDEGKLNKGEVFILDVEKLNLPASDKAKIDAQIKADPKIIKMELTGIDNSNKIAKWLYDDKQYSIGELSWLLLKNLGLEFNGWGRAAYFWKKEGTEAFLNEFTS
jgi:hypothetical protein